RHTSDGSGRSCYTCVHEHRFAVTRVAGSDQHHVHEHQAAIYHVRTNVPRTVVVRVRRLCTPVYRDLFLHGEPLAAVRRGRAGNRHALSDAHHGLPSKKTTTGSLARVGISPGHIAPEETFEGLRGVVAQP